MVVPGTDHCAGNLTGMAIYCCPMGLQPLPAAEWSLFFIKVSYTFCGVIGSALNLFTLLALFMNKEISHAPATSLVLNLAFADLLFCTLAIPTDAVSFLSNYHWNSSTLSSGLCSLAGWIKYTSGAVDWWSLALISVERYFKIVLGSEAHEKFFCRRNKIILILSCWAITITFVTAFAQYGYNDWTSRCDWIPSQSSLHFMDRGKSHLIYMIMVVILIVCACLRIWYHVHQSGCAVVRFSSSLPQTTALKTMNKWSSLSILTTWHKKQHQDPATTPSADDSPEEQERSSLGHQNLESVIPATSSLSREESHSSCPNLLSPLPPRRQSTNRELMQGTFHARELALVKMLAITTGSYIILAMPICILNLVDYCVQHPNLRHMLYSAYVWTFVLNFFIYVRAHPLYRKSCLLLLERVNIFKAIWRKNNREGNSPDVPL